MQWRLICGITLYGQTTGVLYARDNHYDAEGQQIKMSTYLPSDQLVLYQLYEYNEKGDLSEYAEYLYTGELQWEEVFVYDEKGEFIGKDLYDGGGEFDSINGKHSKMNDIKKI